MNASIYRINLDMHKIDSQALLNIKQNDNARHIVFSLSDGGKPYTIPNNCRAVLRAKKPDDTILFNDCVIKSDNTIAYDVTNQTTAAEGIVECELTLYGEDGNVITTPNFSMRIDKHMVTDGEIESTNEFTTLDRALVAVDNLGIAAEKTGNVTTVTVTHKDGSYDSVTVSDGPKGDKGDKGDPGEDAVTDEHYSPQSANAQSGKAVAEAVNPIMRYITYLMKTNFVAITGCDTSISGSYEIPREIGGLPVTRIVGAFNDCIDLTSITIPESVTWITFGAFRGAGLTSITIPNSVTQIGFSAFYGCTGLTDVYYSGTETEWGDIDIDDENEDLLNATIHYNQSPAVKQDIYDYHDKSKADKTDTYTKSEIDERADEFAQQALVELAKKQDKTDNSLQTESKNIVGAINENAWLIENVKNYVGYEPQDVIGLQVDFENRIFKRLGGAEGKTAGSDFDQFNMFGGRRRCNVADDGTINAYYGDAGYTEDGSNGQVMVYQPKFYYKVVPLKLEKNTVSGIGYHIRKANYCVSDTPKTGFKVHPAFYDANGNVVDYILLSAYEGSMWDASQNKYINDSVDKSIAYAAGDLLCSVAEKKPISGLRSGMGTKENFEAMSGNRGTGWHLETIKITSANQLLMMVELGTMNTQTAIGQGVVSVSDNYLYNCSSYTGSTASLGNTTGQATETINEIGGTETTYTASGKLSITYRGVENPWGNIWKYIQGINIYGDGTVGGGQPYIANNFVFSESKNYDNYEPVGFTLPNTNGYVNAMGYGSKEFDWLLMPSEVGGTSALPVGDYCYVTSNLSGYKIARLGGCGISDASAGGFYWACVASIDGSHKTIGGRLVYVPTATT